jgi:hypothetical protein
MIGTLRFSLIFMVFSGCGISSNTLLDFNLLSCAMGFIMWFFVCLQQVKIAMHPITCTQQDTVETTQVNSTNTSDLIY